MVLRPKRFKKEVCELGKASTATKGWWGTLLEPVSKPRNGPL